MRATCISWCSRIDLVARTHNHNKPHTKAAITVKDEYDPLADTALLTKHTNTHTHTHTHTHTKAAITVKDEYDPLADNALLANAAAKDDAPTESRGRNREETPEGEDRGRELRDSKSDRSGPCESVS